MTERELAGIISTIMGTAINMESALCAGRKVNSPEGMGVLLGVKGIEDVVATLKRVCDILLEAVPDDKLVVKRDEEDKQEQEPQEETSPTKEEAN